MRKVLFVAMLLAGAAPGAYAQNTAVRFILGEGHKVYTTPAFGNYCMGIGVDRSFNDKLAAGVDVTFDIGHALKTSSEYIYMDVQGMDVGYRMTPSLLSINYHTEYALGDDGGTHAYIGTFLGLRHLGQKWRTDGSYYVDINGNPVTVPTPRHVSQWLVPIGIRLGLRGATDGGFMDLYGALGYQIGGGKQLLPGTYAAASYAETNSLAVTIGLAYGIGW